MVGSAGVLGAVDTPGRLLAGRAGNANSFGDSRPIGGEDAPPESGEGCVAERWPGEVTGYEFGRPGTTCRLADLACPRDGRLICTPLS